MPRPLAQCLLFLLPLVGCSDYRACAEPAPALLAQAPTRLSETGLYADIAAGTLAAGVRAYTPEFALWSDGAAKRRWIWLPPGTTIDAADPDDWRFPAGTKMWKEFTRDGVRVETRLLERLPDGEWRMLAYRWTDDGDALAAPEGEHDVRGTLHDIPPARVCTGCHGGVASGVLGFSALQLAQPARPGELDLAELLADDTVTPAPTAWPEVPGDATQRAALGYLHANCGHCHNQDRPPRPGPRCYDPENELDFRLRSAPPSDVSATPAYRSAVGSVIKPGEADRSELIRRISGRSDDSMPPLASEVVDRDGVALLRRWIDEM